MDNPHDGSDLGQVIAPQQEGQGGNILVRIPPLAVHLGIVTVAQTHRGPYLRFAGQGLLVSVNPLTWVTKIVNTCQVGGEENH